MIFDPALLLTSQAWRDFEHRKSGMIGRHLRASAMGAFDSLGGFELLDSMVAINDSSGYE